MSEVPSPVRDAQHVAFLRNVSDQRSLQRKGSDRAKVVQRISRTSEDSWSGESVRAKDAYRFSSARAVRQLADRFALLHRKGGDALVEITSGPDRGQKVLRQSSNIYLFYPDAEEVIWLKGSALKDSMMGSDFSYEDLTNDKTLADRYTSELFVVEGLK